MKKNLENTRDDPLYPSKEFLLERKRKKSMLQNSFSTEREGTNINNSSSDPRSLFPFSSKKGGKKRKERRKERSPCVKIKYRGRRSGKELYS